MGNDIMNKLKEKELELLKYFIDICDKYDLMYYMVEGSCIGAVRHKGFIPWDDDIDVGMPRDDYEKFLKIAQKDLPKHIFVQSHKTDKNYPMNFAKLRNSNTTFIEKSIQDLDINHGIYMDIFPLDGFTKNKFFKYIFIIKKLLLSYRISYLYYRNPNAKKKYTIKFFIKRIIKLISRIIYPRIETAINKRDKLFKKYSIGNSELIANHNSPWEQREIVAKDFFGDGVLGEFEGLCVRLPQDYHSYLSSVYGDYMKLPPEEKRYGHHYYTIIDVDKSYKEYINVSK